MYSKDYQTQSELDLIGENRLYKEEKVLKSLQNNDIQVNESRIINFCTSNYLGLYNNQEVIKETYRIMNMQESRTSSVYPIHESQDIYENLEQKISDFLRMDDTILYAAAFDANGGVFEPLFTQEDVIISDDLNHSSIIDGLRLSKSVRYRYKNNDLNDLETQLQNASSKNYRFKIIVTDGVFSMDGIITNLKGICDLAEKYDALVMVDDSHATGFIGKTGRGTHEYNDVMGRVDIITSTLGKTLGGFTSGKKEIIDLLRQRSRPYLFSNSLTSEIVEESTKIIDILLENNTLAKKVMQNAEYFRTGMKNAGFDIIDGDTAIIPIMLYDAKLAQEFADKLVEEEVYAIGFFFPVVPKGKARIRVQLSAIHTQEHLDKAIKAFTKVGKELGVI